MGNKCIRPQDLFAAAALDQTLTPPAHTYALSLYASRSQFLISRRRNTRAGKKMENERPLFACSAC